MDQGVTVLRVGPNDVTLGRTPMLEPDRNRRTREVALTLAAEGSGTVDVREEVRGAEAPGYRSRFQAEGLRRERLERQMRNLFPGLELTQTEFGALDDFNAPVSLRFGARVPQLAVRDGRLLRVAPSVLNELSRSLAPASERRLPLDLSTRTSYEETRRVRLPAGFRVEDLPQGGTAESPFGRLEMEVRQEGREVRLTTRLNVTQDRIAPSDYGTFRRWVEEADRILRQRLILAPGGEP